MAESQDQDVAFECLELKKEHDTCFYRWLNEFLDNKKPTDYCQPIFVRYQDCLKGKLEKMECGFLMDTPHGAPLRPQDE